MYCLTSQSPGMADGVGRTTLRAMLVLVTLMVVLISLSVDSSYCSFRALCCHKRVGAVT